MVPRVTDATDVTQDRSRMRRINAQHSKACDRSSLRFTECLRPVLKSGSSYALLPPMMVCHAGHAADASRLAQTTTVKRTLFAKAPAQSLATFDPRTDTKAGLLLFALFCGLDASGKSDPPSWPAACSRAATPQLPSALAEADCTLHSREKATEAAAAVATLRRARRFFSNGQPRDAAP